MADRDVALDTLAREELGLDPDDLGSPWGAALSSLFAFAIGAFVVVIPYLAGSGTAALLAAIVLVIAALFGVGASIGALNGRGVIRSGPAPGHRGRDRRGDHLRRRPPDRHARLLTNPSRAQAPSFRAGRSQDIALSPRAPPGRSAPDRSELCDDNRVQVLRTPEDGFTGLPDFDYPPRYADLGGLRMAYVEAGPPDGEAVLLLHGEPTWSFLYRTVMAVLAAPQ